MARHPYGPLRRMKTAYRFIRSMADRGPEYLERTQSRHVGPTYGLPPSLIKQMKAKFRNELSFGGEGK
jgi:hypothetical protein